MFGKGRGVVRVWYRSRDVLPRRPDEEEEAKKPAPKKQRRPSRFSEEEEDEMDDIEYSGRIH